MAEIQNANPTIRNVSDLPTRRRRTSSPSSKKRTLGLFANSIPSPAYLSDPFDTTRSASGSDSDDDDTLEPIDEQEIYGESNASTWLKLSRICYSSQRDTTFF